MEGRALRSTSGGRDDADEEESEGEDSDNEGRDYSWKKTIMIGPTYQASVPSDLSSYGDTLPYGKMLLVSLSCLFLTLKTKADRIVSVKYHESLPFNT